MQGFKILSLTGIDVNVSLVIQQLRSISLFSFFEINNIKLVLIIL